MAISKANPFNWGFDCDTTKSITYYAQRNAQYSEAAEEQFQGDSVKTFMFNEEAPTPQLCRVYGYDAQQEIYGDAVCPGVFEYVAQSSEDATEEGQEETTDTEVTEEETETETDKQ